MSHAPVPAAFGLFCSACGIGSVTSAPQLPDRTPGPPCQVPVGKTDVGRSY